MNNAFVLRIRPSGIDRVPEALQAKDIIIGWARAGSLLDPDLEWEQFRQTLHEEYYSGDENYSRSGSAAGNLWRFIREMREGDRVVVPYGNEFFVAEVVGPVRYEDERMNEDTAFRRSVEWINGGESIPRKYARAALQRRMKTRHTCTKAGDLLEEVEEVIEAAKKDEAPSFEKDLRLKLVDETLKEIRSGLMNDYGFERLVETILRSLGASEVRILSRSKEDKGADIVAAFSLVKTFDFVLAVQAKHYEPDPPVGAETVDQLVRGMEAEGTELGWIVTSGRFSEEAFERKVDLEEKRGFRIELVDGEQLAAMIVEGGLRETR